LFAYLLMLVETDAARRTYAAYGGVYIVASILWLWIVQGQRPDRWDVTGSSSSSAHRSLGGAAALSAR
jgi:small multidrug resistance family-3 protein